MKESLYHPKMVSNRLCALSLDVLPKTEEAESGPLLSEYIYIYIYTRYIGLALSSSCSHFKSVEATNPYPIA